MSSTIQKIVETFPDLVQLVRGHMNTPITALRAAETAGPQDLIFVSNAEHLQAALKSASQCWLVHTSMLAKIPEQVRVVLASSNVQLCMARLGRQLFPQTAHHQIVTGPAIHPSAVISSTAQVAPGCRIGPGAVIGDDCKIGANCVVGANAILENGVQLGARCHIHPLVFIGHDCVLGEDCEVKPHTTIGGEGYGYAQDAQFNHHRITHYGRVILEDRVHIGAGVQIDRGTFLDSRIGAGTKIDNHCHFGHNFVVGKNTLITGGMIAAGSVTLGSYCVFGGRTTIKGHLSVGDRIQIAALSAVGKSVNKPGEYGGFPLQDIRSEMRTRAALKTLPVLVKQVRRILKHLGIDAESISPE